MLGSAFPESQNSETEVSPMAIRQILFITVISLAFASSLGADEDAKSWLRKTVLPTKPSEVIRFGDWVDGKQVYFPLKTVDLSVREVRDGWVRIHDGIREGWVDKSDVILMDDGPAYFHRRVQANPKDSWALFMRGVGWLKKGNPDNAIKDLDEYIRLESDGSAAFNARGSAYFDKKDYDKAIKDYNEAIRLEPKNAICFNNRGNAYK